MITEEAKEQELKKRFLEKKMLNGLIFLVSVFGPLASVLRSCPIHSLPTILETQDQVLVSSSNLVSGGTQDIPTISEKQSCGGVYS